MNPSGLSHESTHIQRGCLLKQLVVPGMKYTIQDPQPPQTHPFSFSCAVPCQPGLWVEQAVLSHPVASSWERRQRDGQVPGGKRTASAP